jgi:hypothetical protein
VPPDPVTPPSHRPGYLVIALLVAWFVGLRTAHEGYVVMSVATNPLTGDSLALAPVLRDAMVQSLTDTANVAVPLGLAQLLLGGLLMSLAAIALFRGRVSVSFTLQTLLANAALAVVGHVLGAPVREAMVRVLAGSPELLGVDAGVVSREELVSVYRLAFHLGLAVQVGVLALLAFAFTRPAARAFLHAPPRPHEER